jgi:hypothetical protein
MRVHLILAAALLALAQTATADELTFGQKAVAEDELAGKRGGTDTTSGISNSLLQSNDSALTGTNNGNISVGGGAAKYSGVIAPAQVTGNNGITAVMQNTGDLVNMNNATSVNVYMR